MCQFIDERFCLRRNKIRGMKQCTYLNIDISTTERLKQILTHRILR